MITTETGYKRKIAKLEKYIKSLKHHEEALEKDLAIVYKMIETNGEHQVLTNDNEVKFIVKVIHKEPIDLSETGKWTEIY